MLTGGEGAVSVIPYTMILIKGDIINVRLLLVPYEVLLSGLP